MSRLDSMIRRLMAQRACLDAVTEMIRTLPGPILEIGLGNGRTYDHLRKRLPERSIFVFDLIVLMLKQSENGEVNEEVALSQLALHFPHERPQRILRAIVGWARYAGLFKYSSTRKVFYGLKAA